MLVRPSVRDGMDAKETAQSGSPAGSKPQKKPAPVLRWPGGKSRMLKRLLPLVPPHTCYVEPFAGGLALLLAKERSPVEVINDLNGDLIALYRCIQYHLPELLRELDHLVASRESLKDFRTQPGITDIQRGARFYFRNRISFAGSGASLGVARTKGGGVGFFSSRNEDLLGAARPRLSGVVVENLPYERCLDLYDGPETFFFLDPPYLGAEPKIYRGWTESEMKAFRARLRTLKGTWLVTVDDSPLNRELWSDCHVEAVSTPNGCLNNRTDAGSRFGELIIRPK